MLDSPYLSPEEAAYAAADATDKALGAVIAKLALLFLEKEKLHEEIEACEDDDEIVLLEEKLKLLRDRERSLRYIESGLQSRLRAADK